jgi:hypothetical protein
MCSCQLDITTEDTFFWGHSYLQLCLTNSLLSNSFVCMYFKFNMRLIKDSDSNLGICYDAVYVF